jgi:hypothetical protein
VAAQAELDGEGGGSHVGFRLQQSAEGGELPERGDGLGCGEPFAVGVLGVLAEAAVDLGVGVGGVGEDTGVDDGGDLVASGYGGGEGAACSEAELVQSPQQVGAQFVVSMCSPPLMYAMVVADQWPPARRLDEGFLSVFE